MKSTQAIGSVLNKGLVVLVLCALSAIVLVKGLFQPTAHSNKPQAQERNLKVKEFKDIPVALVEVRNLQSETWYKDLEIEVKNVSDKPIYAMLAYLVFPDFPASGGESGIHLSYGNGKKNGDIAKPAAVEDKHLRPGENYIFTIPEMYRKGLKAKHEKFQDLTKNLLIRFAMINFGDGTGFEAGRSLDLRGKGPPFKPPKSHHPNSSNKTTRSSSSSNSTPAQSDCGGVNCWRWRIPADPGPTSCFDCFTFVATTDPS